MISPIPICPLLPPVEEELNASTTRIFAGRKCDGFYEAALRYAHSLWLQGKPAQAILQINKSFMADLRGGEPVLATHPPGYRVIVWFLRHHPEGTFIGNPVRHFQHLATRVSGERRELRSWRAWACYYLSSNFLPPDDYPPDHEQIQEEALAIPSWDDVLQAITTTGWPGEAEALLVAQQDSLSR